MGIHQTVQTGVVMEELNDVRLGESKEREASTQALMDEQGRRVQRWYHAGWDGTDTGVVSGFY